MNRRHAGQSDLLHISLLRLGVLATFVKFSHPKPLPSPIGPRRSSYPCTFLLRGIYFLGAKIALDGPPPASVRWAAEP